MAFSKMIKGLAYIESIKDIANSGVTLPLKCIIKEIGEAYAKYIGNPFGTQVLVNEWIGACVADVIGLPIPNYGICYLPESVVINGMIEEIDASNVGKAFYTKAFTKAVPVNRGLLQKVINGNIETILVYDHLVNNCDRHKGNVLCDLNQGPQIVLIDNSELFTDKYRYDERLLLEELKIDRIVSGNIFNSNQEIYDLLIGTFGLNKDALFLKSEEAKEVLTDDILNTIKKTIPEEWLIDVRGELIELIFEQVSLRRDNMDAICDCIIMERKK